MTEANLESLSGLLDRLSNTLLQYAADSSIWASEADAERQEKVLALVRRQRFSAERLAEFLADRRAVVRLENYPFDGTPLNYVTVDYIKPRLIEDETRLVEEIRSCLTVTTGDPEAQRLLEQLLADEEQTLEQVKAL